MTDAILLGIIVAAVATPFAASRVIRWSWRAPERRARRAYRARERARREGRA